jgi:hypothetical protein
MQPDRSGLASRPACALTLVPRRAATARAFADFAHHAEIRIALIADLAIVHVNNNGLRVAVATTAEARAKVKRCADQQNDIGVVEGGLARGYEIIRITARWAATRAAIDVRGNTELARISRLVRQSRYSPRSRCPTGSRSSNRGILSFAQAGSHAPTRKRLQIGVQTKSRMSRTPRAIGV